MIDQWDRSWEWHGNDIYKMNFVLTESSTHPRRLPLESEALAVMSILPWAKKAMKEGTYEQERGKKNCFVFMLSSRNVVYSAGRITTQLAEWACLLSVDEGDQIGTWWYGILVWAMSMIFWQFSPSAFIAYLGQHGFGTFDGHGGVLVEWATARKSRFGDDVTQNSSALAVVWDLCQTLNIFQGVRLRFNIIYNSCLSTIETQFDLNDNHNYVAIHLEHPTSIYMFPRSWSTRPSK